MENEIQTEIQAETQPEIKTTKCLNCGTEFDGKYCPECGQSAETGRFTLRFIWENLLAAVLGRDGGIGFTIKNLFTRPGAMIVDILNGKRRKYLSPFPTLFLALTLYVLIFTATGSKSLKPEDKADWGTELSENDTVEEFGIELPNWQWETEPSENTQEMFSKKTNQLILDVYHFYLNHYTLCYMLTLPLFVIAARRCYGKENRKRYNRAEYIVAIVYSMVMLILYRCVINLFYPFWPGLYESMALLEPFALIAAFTLCFRRMMGFSPMKTVWRSTMTVGLYYIFLGILSLIIVVGFSFYIVLKLQNS